MGAKLEWERDLSGVWWHAKRRPYSDTDYWSISVDGEGAFRVAGQAGTYQNLPDAKAWCEEQDRLAAAATPEIPLPKPGDVWGVPDRPETWRKIIGVPTGVIQWCRFCLGGFASDCQAKWSAWVRETDAVELIGNSEALRQRAEAAEASRERLMAGLREIRELGGAWCGTKVDAILAAEEGAAK